MSKEINGKYYPLWSGIIERKGEFIGGILRDLGDDHGHHILETEITDIELGPNGDDSTYFAIAGKDFRCGFDCGYGGVIAGEEGWITFSGYGGHTFAIRGRKQ